MYRRLLFPVIYGAMLKLNGWRCPWRPGFRVYPGALNRRLNFRFVDYMVLIFPLITIVLICCNLVENVMVTI